MGIAVDLNKVTNEDTLTVQRGRALMFGGGPVGIEGDDTEQNSTGDPNVYADLSYKINEAGTLKSWTIRQTDVAGLPYNIGSIKLVILRLSGTDYIIVGVAEQDRNITGAGVWEFPCEITVERNDVVGFWLPDSSLSLSANTDLDDPSGTTLLLRFNNVPTVVATDNLGAPDVVSGGKLYHVAARGDIDQATIADVDTVWEADGTGDDVHSYFQFVQSTDAFEESSVNNPANLFNVTDTSAADVATGVSTNNNVYYFLDHGADTDLVPVERFVINITSIPAGGAVKVYGSVDVAQVSPMDLTKAQAVTGWVLLQEFDNSMNSEEYTDAVYHVAQKFKWLRLEIVGATAASTDVGAFEAQVMNNQVSDGILSPHSDANLKNRYFFDTESFTQAVSKSAIITQTVLSIATEVFVENADTEFLNQIIANGYVYLRRDVPRGSNNVMKRVQVSSVDIGLKKLILAAAPGEDFSVGDFVDPEAWFLRFFVKDSGGTLFAASNWVGTHSTYPPWVRSHDVFTIAGN